MSSVKAILNEVHNNLFERASAFLMEHTNTVKIMGEFKAVLRKKGGFIKAAWCSGRECEDKIKEETSADIRLIPFNEKVSGKCVYCGSAGKVYAYFAKAY